MCECACVWEAGKGLLHLLSAGWSYQEFLSPLSEIAAHSWVQTRAGSSDLCSWGSIFPQGLPQPLFTDGDRSSVIATTQKSLMPGLLEFNKLYRGFGGVVKKSHSVLLWGHSAIPSLCFTFPLPPPLWEQCLPCPGVFIAASPLSPRGGPGGLGLS